MEENVTHSILAVDFGSIHTRAILIDVVEGVYRLVARGETRSTDGFPVNDLAVGFDRVVRQISATTGRELLMENGQVIKPEREGRVGVDYFALTASIGRPLRAVVVGLMPNVSIASALRAASGTYINVAATLSLDDGRSEEDQFNDILLSYPDVIFITGGTERGAENSVLRMAEITRTALTLLEEDSRPGVIYSGNRALVEPITKMFENLTTLWVAENIRPSLEKEQLDSARLQLGRAFDRYKEKRDASFAMIGAMSDTGILPTAQSYTVLAEYLGRADSGSIALVDIGSSAGVLAISHKGERISSIRTDLGLGHSAPQALEAIGIDKIRRWIPFNIAENVLKNYALNKSLRPATVPLSLRDLYMEHALLRAGIRAMIADINPDWVFTPIPFQQVIGAGAALSNTGNPGYDALLLIDAVQPAGVTVLRNDAYGLVATMGAIAVSVPEAVVQLLENDSLPLLGTCVSPIGKLPKNKKAMQVKIIADYGDEEEVVEETILGGHLWVYPLPPGRTAQVEIKCRRQSHINGKRKLKLTMTGGLVGLIFDARGRPLPLVADVRQRAEQFPLWVQEMTGNPLLEIKEEWLAEPEPEKVAEATPSDKKQRKKQKDKKSAAKKGAGEAALRPQEKEDKKGEKDTRASEDDLDALLADTDNLIKADDDLLGDLRDDVLS